MEITRRGLFALLVALPVAVTAVLKAKPQPKVFVANLDAPVRALWNDHGRVFAVSGNAMYEIFPNGSVKATGCVSDSCR